jgi:SAM-dependent MidA family methyltransferase
MWERVGRPNEFVVVEMGAGTGVLCRDILQELEEAYTELYVRIKYITVEISPRLVTRQKTTLLNLPVGIIECSASRLPLAGVCGCFLSNELVDAFPFHRVIADKGGLKEIYIGHEDDSFFEVTGKVSHPHISQYISRFGLKVDEGKEFCVNLNALRWLGGLVQAMERGFIITMDYGYAAPDAISKRGNPARFFGPRHQVGQFDITADVDFHALRVYGEELGLATDTLVDEVDYTSGFAGFPMGTRGTTTRARYVLVQRKT